HFPDHVLLFTIFYFSEAWGQVLAGLLGTVLLWARPTRESSSRPCISAAHTLRCFGTAHRHSARTLKSKTWSGEDGSDRTQRLCHRLPHTLRRRGVLAGDKTVGDGDHRLELRRLLDDRPLLGESALQEEGDDRAQPHGFFLLIREGCHLLPGDEVGTVREPDVDERRGAVADRRDDAARLEDPGRDPGDGRVPREIPHRAVPADEKDADVVIEVHLVEGDRLPDPCHHLRGIEEGCVQRVLALHTVHRWLAAHRARQVEVVAGLAEDGEGVSELGEVEA